MSQIINIDTIVQANEVIGKVTLHPLVTVLDFTKHGRMEYQRMNLNLFGVFLKDTPDAEVIYGRHHYDYHQGTLIFISPGQVVGLGSRAQGESFQPSGWGLMFHNDLLLGTSLGSHIKDYTFFSYDVHEALHISSDERNTIIDCFKKIQSEEQRGIDKHSRKLIVSNIELLLNYCERFYDRQFISREHVNKDILVRFEDLLNTYFAANDVMKEGMLTVQYCAEQLHLSSNYFGDLIKRETGRTAQEYIQQKVIEVAKERLFNSNKTVAEISYELGFKYPQHFVRLFKQKVGYTPKEYREQSES